MESDAGQVLKVLSGGDFFGEIGILSLSEGQNRRTADIRTVGYVECFVLSKEDVLNATRDYPEAQAVLAEYGRRRLEGQTTCKDPRLVDMEDCDTTMKQEGTAHTNNNVQLKPIENITTEKIEDTKSASDMTVNSSNPLASQSSSSYTSSVQTDGSSTHSRQASNGPSVESSQDPFVSPLDNLLNPRRLSRSGLLDPIRPSSPKDNLPAFYHQSFTNIKGMSKSMGSMEQEHSLDANPGEKDAILKMVTSSLNEVVNYAKKETKKQMDKEMKEIQSQLRTVKDEVLKKNMIIDHMTELLSTQETELEAWRDVVHNLETKRAEANKEILELKTEIQVLRHENNIRSTMARLELKEDDTTC